MFVYLHMLFPIFFALYGFLFKKSKFDILYLCGIYFVLLHWTFFDSECALAYYYKKNKNPNYIAGSDLKNDFHHHFKGYSMFIYVSSFILNIGMMLSFYKVVTRYYPKGFAYSFILLYLTFYYGSYLFVNHPNNPSFLLFQEMIKYTTIVWGLVLLLCY